MCYRDSPRLVSVLGVVAAACLIASCAGIEPSDNPGESGRGDAVRGVNPTAIVVEGVSDADEHGAGDATGTDANASSEPTLATEQAPGDSAPAAVQPRLSVGTGYPSPGEEEFILWQSGRDLRSCDDLIDGWVHPLYHDDWEEPVVLTGEAAVAMYVVSYFQLADMDTWLYDDGPPLDNDARARLADHLRSLVDDEGRYCGLLEAGTDELAELSRPVPTRPPPGTVDEYTAWALDRCDRAEDGMHASMAAMAEVFNYVDESGAPAESPEDTRWNAYMIMHSTIALAESVERRSHVPWQADELHALVTEMGAELYDLVNTLGAQGPLVDPIQLNQGYDRVTELCVEIDQLAAELRVEHVR